MSSSESEDDCYGNTAQRLQKMKNHYSEDRFESTNLLNDSQDQDIDETLKNNPIVPAKTGKRGRKKAGPDSTDATGSVSVSENNKTAPENSPKSKRRRITRNSIKHDAPETEPVETPPPPPPATRGRRGARGRRGRQSTVPTNDSIQDLISPSPPGRRPGQHTMSSIFQDMLTASASRGRGRGRRSRGRGLRRWLQSIASSMPIYSVGNTSEYPDQLEDQQLFSAPKKDDKDDVCVVEDEDENDDNEELSVKVFWQSSDYFKFSIRKFQKLTQIFDYFAKKENVSHANLLFTYNEKILRADYTPDSINYNIGKFIDGGIVNKSIYSLVKTDDCKTVKNGIKIKFQLQNVKKPFETTVSLDDRLSIAMMKCAEHLETPMDRLKFVFDGDTVSSKSTARDLEFEGGECIDVKILS